MKLIKKIFKNIGQLIYSQYYKIKTEIEFRKRLKKIKEQDPFIYD